jgi:tight adherence protein B
MLILLFAVLMIEVFFVVVLATKPSKEEVNLGKRLAGLDRGNIAEQVIDSDILKREAFSDLPLVNAILRRMKLAASIDVLIKQSNSSWTVGRVLFGSLVIFVIVGALGAAWMHSPPIGVMLGIVAATGPYFSLVLKRKARLDRFAAVLPDAIDLMARALRAGHAVTAAIEMVSREVSDPVGPEFRRVFEEQTFGLPIREALVNLAERIPIADLQFLVTAMLVQKETGGNLAEVLDKAGAVIRERARLLGQLRIYTAQGRMTGWILGLLPFIVFIAMNFANPSYARTLLNDPIGRKAIWFGLGMMVIGVWTIRKIVDIKV